MGRKKIVYLQLYIKDYTGDERLRWCSPSAWGVYSYLLCLLTTAEVRGSLQLSKLEKHPQWKNSLTNRCLAATTTRRRLGAWASILGHQMPWKKVQILDALSELAQFKVIIVQGESLIQPRMYRESGHKLDPQADYLSPQEKPSSPSSSSMSSCHDDSASTSSSPSSSTSSPSPSPDSESASDGLPVGTPPPAKPKKSSPNSKPSTVNSKLPFQSFWDAYDKKRDRPKSEELWSKLTAKDQQAIMDYLPSYIAATPEKRFRKDPTTFLRHRSWEDEIIQDQPNKKKPANPTILNSSPVDAQEDW